MRPNHRVRPKHILALALIAAAIAFWLFVQSSVVCFGEGCLARYSEKGDSARYHFPNRHCFLTTETVYGGYRHLRYARLIGLIISLGYLVDPGMKLFIIPDRSEDLPIIIFDHLHLRGHLHVEFCDVNVRLVREDSGLVLTGPTP